MGIPNKLARSAAVIFLGSVIVVLIQNTMGYGQYIATLFFIVIPLFYIWGKRSPGERTPVQRNTSQDESPVTIGASEANIDENEVYASVWDEIKREEIANKGLWAKVFSESNGDINKTQAAYIKYRTEELIMTREAQRRIEREQKEANIKEAVGGAIVSRPRRCTRAEKAGVLAGDIIIEYNNKDVRGDNPIELLNKESAALTGQVKVSVKLIRDGDMKELFIAGGEIGADFANSRLKQGRNLE
jgi:hypothetical protein